MSAKPDSAQSKEELLAAAGRDTLPDGWDGGKAYHSGGGIWIRQFTNEERELQVTYSLQDGTPGVGLDEITWDADLETWLPEDTIATEPDPATDAEKFEAALKFMQTPEEYQ
ncbi:hypothetical protein AArcSl_1634 [Halalkaliarchaeum desulfuricum]|uniref:Uncharacterized protein n=1 Tax=Halalkaliarchaeum desulfuricum TaxID=2055893 RepID=A0A343TJJ1_9EURY|nr:hypothetical protein [Halalkaliarchaeum desulfuricum]AUX09263.1 hypothetical protein AArcSl_1634 [Halalkaliarchaeum desulfuricum]